MFRIIMKCFYFVFCFFIYYITIYVRCYIFITNA